MSAAGDKLRYVVVASVCALVYNGAMIGADIIGLHYAIALAITFVVVVLLGYSLHVRYTFRTSLSVSGLFRYAVPMAANFPLTLAAMFVLCDLLGLAVAIAAPITTVLMFAMNYVLSKWAIVGADRRTGEKQ
jgi:putative flippase GtrA